jgi:hypothetical protein
MKVIEPDASEYYGRHFGRNAEFTFDSNARSDAYISDAIAYHGDVVCWWGESGKWSCWAERSANVCVLRFESDVRFKQELYIKPDDYVRLFDLEDALKIARLEFTREDAFESFADAMRAAYG